jgi:ubiquinone/menaquinone biosynthesis C-methylase UbiE
MTTQTMDTARAEAFAGQVIGILNGGMTSLMISVGHRTGLFDAMASLPPSTSEGIAKATGLNERYVREWLGNMTTAHIVEHDAVKGTYWLPAEHAASITRAAGPGNLSNFAEFVSQMGMVEDGIVEAFQKGGGVPYSEFPKFQGMMARLSAEIFDATLLDVVIPLTPGLREKLEAGAEAADIGCGQGHAINLLAKAFPRSRFTGYDFSSEGVGAGRAEAKSMGLTNASFEERDVTALGETSRFDLITAFDSIHDQAHPRKVLKGIYEALKPGGTFLMVDIAADSSHQGNMEHPMAPAFYAISTFHCMTVSLALGGEGLGNMWGTQKARELLAEAGFKDVDIKNVEGDIMNAYYICKK